MLSQELDLRRNRFRRYENYYGTLPRIEPAKNTTVERRLHRRNSDVSSRNYSLLGLPHNLFLFQSPMEDERLSLEREIYLNNIYPSYEMRHSTSHQRPIDSSTPNRLNGMLRQSISENEQPIQSLCCGLNLPRKTILPYHRVEAFNYKSYLIHGPEYNDWIDLWGDIRYSFIYSHIPHTLMMIISIISFCFPLTTVALAMYVKARNNWKERFTVSSQTNPVTSEEAENIYEKNRSKSITQMNYSVAIVTISIIVNFCLIITFLISLQFMDDDDLQKNIINKLFSIFQE
ncbi:hypothetical protein SNEBB_000422 [Seison nebaliae]|nr:hypothetical protein SNEBB_000422 [Seison nebaliae]